MSPVHPEAVRHFVAARAQRPDWPAVPAHLRPATVDDGYALQAAVHAALAAAGIARVGYKVGSTSPSGQRSFGLDEPAYAGLFADGRHASLRAALTQPMRAPSVECEIALVLGRDLSGAAVSREEAAAAVATCHLGCEVIDNRYGAPLEHGVPSLLADDFFNAGFVLGEAEDGWTPDALRGRAAEVVVDGRRFAGNTSDVLDAVDALRWLAGKLAARGLGLRAGEIVFTGAVVPPVAIAAPPTDLALRIEGFRPLTY